ncbi:rod shape-determining protein RodA [Thermoleophilum album]|uniref:rod shape-determining protein RodA n=1 Tax=Thermoleophilum album TaxID=29539 RepID=UPI003D15A4D6|nr:rod shape-determining protein RodA [Thermoleophilum album]
MGLLAASIVVLLEATTGDIPGQPYYYVWRQLAYGVVGLVLMLAVSRIDYSRLREYRNAIYLGMIGSIVAVFAIGSAARGSRRWIELPFFNFQPSELGKLLLVVALAGFVVDRIRQLHERQTTVKVTLLGLGPATLVVAQPDLGTGLVYLAITGAVLFVAGTRWSHLAALAAVGVSAAVFALVVAPAVGVEVLKPYQRDRLTAFLHPTADPREEGYQVNQSLTAIGAGGKTGRGSEATQTKLNFLPEHHTDFIFAVVGEVFGFVGAALVLSLYALLIWRALRVVTLAKNLFGALLAAGVTAMLMFQVFVNVGMTIGLAPITGVPLPLLSYGGSSVIVTLLALGLLQSIHARSRELSLAKAVA